jgi:hypothetical protein
MERREFLRALALAAAQAGLPGIAKGSTFAQDKGKVLLSLSSPGGKGSVLRILDWDDLSHKDYAVSLSNPHSMVLDRKNPSVAYLFESFGSGLRVDLATRQEVKIDHLTSGFLFSGHGVQTRAGEHLFCTEFGKDRQGSVSVRDARTLEKVGATPRECDNSHQVVHLPGGTVIACGNLSVKGKAKRGAITFYDYEKNQVLDQVAFDYPILHLAPLSSSEVLAVSLLFDRQHGQPSPDKFFGQSSHETTSEYFKDTTFRPGPVCYAKTDGSSKQFWDESELDLFRFNFGVAPLPSSNKFLSSHRLANAVLLWKDGKIAHRFSVPAPSHLLVAKNGKEMMVRCGDSYLKLFSLETMGEVGTISDPGRSVLALAAY